MSASAQIQAKAQPAAKSVSVTNHAQSGLALRKCACGESAGIDGECSECREKKLTVQRRAVNGAQPPSAPSSPGQPSNPGSGVQRGAGAGYNISRIRVSAAVPGRIQAKLTVNEPGDKYEQEADQVAEQVMRMSAPTSPIATSMPDDDEPEDESLRRKEGRGAPIQGTGNIPPIVDSVLSSGGQPLDGTTRSFMEPRFGHDFSRVRVHTDAKAMESARVVNALAYTVGRDVVFGGGQYAPRTAGGQRLLAHELTHVVQQSSPFKREPSLSRPARENYEQEMNPFGLAVTTLLTRKTRYSNGTNRFSSAPSLPLKVSRPSTNFGEVRIQRKPPKQVQKEVLTEEIDVAGLIKEIVDVVRLVMDKKEDKDFNAIWRMVKEQIKSPKSKAPKGHEEFAELYTEKVAGDLKKLAKLARKEKSEIINEVLNGVLNDLVKERTGITGIDYKREYDELLQIQSVKGNIEGKLEDYISSLRPALIEKFCSFAGIKQYYQDEIIKGSFLGQHPWVHKDMQERLKATEVLLSRDRLKSKELEDAIKAKRISIGGLEIRANANRKKKNDGKINLSKHSFGWAIDINAKMNPNVPNFPAALVKEFTKEGESPGEDVFSGEAVSTIRAVIHGKNKKKVTLEDILSSVQSLRRASDRFKETSKQVFKDEKSLRDKLTDYLQKRGADVAESKSDELIVLFKKVYEDEQAYKKGDKKEKKELEKKLQESYDSLKKDISGVKAMLKEPEDADKFLLAVYNAYAGTRDEEGKFKEVKAEIIGTPATIAIHGFINLPPELITALVSKEGGGLNWLGAVDERNTKDFMHFELIPYPNIKACGDSSPSKNDK